MKSLFITSTLHSDWNIDFNPKLCQALEHRGFRCYLPQRDTKQEAVPEIKFRQNIDGIKNSKKFLAVCKNYTPNFGLEVGYAYGLGKEIIFLTDDVINIPLMIKGVTDNIIIIDNLDDIDDYLDNLIEVIK